MFFHVSVILFTGGYLPHCMLGYTILGMYTPWAGTPLLQRYTPRQVHPSWAGTPPPGRYYPGQVHPPGRYTPPGKVQPPAGTPLLGRYTPRQVHPSWAGTPPGRCTPLAGAPLLGRYTLQQVHPSWAGTAPCALHAGIRSTSRRYTSHWNAILFGISFAYSTHVSNAISTKTKSNLLPINPCLSLFFFSYKYFFSGFPTFKMSHSIDCSMYCCKILAALTLLLPTNEVCGKVMFLQMSVCPQGQCMATGMRGRGRASQRGRAWQGRCAWQGEHALQGGCAWQGACVGGLHVWQRGCVAGEMATAADGTHSTGIHSCYVCFRLSCLYLYI